MSTERLDRRLNDRVAIRFRTWPLGDDLGLPAELLAFGRDLLQFARVVGTQHHIGSGAGKDLRRHRTERTGGTGDDCGLAANVEERERVLQEIFRHYIARNLHEP
jgi:hypothetical protein